MATDIVAQLADSLAKTGVQDGELSYKGQGRKLDDAQSEFGNIVYMRFLTTSVVTGVTCLLVACALKSRLPW
ncbi:hypothetical protein GOODEAATRI_013578 [Goodea atripinnis]|uniref:Uncharacterized protein n=1 Tax=Goodea atripinnis TaxID=208336 RepID=A0ABV0N4B0_9TELE